MQSTMKMMSNLKIPLLLFLLLAFQYTKAQSEALTSSPYSLYGLGVVNHAGTGKFNALGYTGLAMDTDDAINNLNPANYGLIGKNSFFYDIGLKGEYNSYVNRLSSGSRESFNFSNLALAFSVAKGLGVGLTLIPYSEVGYSVVGVTTNIEGSDEMYSSDVSGIGGINEFRLNTGYALTDDLRIGFNTSFLFGSVDETVALSGNLLSVNEKTSYRGLGVGFGVQYDLWDKLSLGATLKLPVQLNASQAKSVSKVLDGVEAVVEEQGGETIEAFKLPMELGVGLTSRWLDDKLALNLDLKKNFWDDTQQSDHLGTYKDQHILGVGLEYLKDRRSINYADRITFMTGFNIDDGYLEINDKSISGYQFSAGVGLPVGRGNRSALNVSYSYGTKGTIDNILIREKYHLLTLNISLEDMWFVDRLIN